MVVSDSALHLLEGERHATGECGLREAMKQRESRNDLVLIERVELITFKFGIEQRTSGFKHDEQMGSASGSASFWSLALRSRSRGASARSPERSCLLLRPCSSLFLLSPFTTLSAEHKLSMTLLQISWLLALSSLEYLSMYSLDTLFGTYSGGLTVPFGCAVDQAHRIHCS